MSRPESEGGWFKMPHDLDAALAAADFTKGARLVLHEVFTQCYGPAHRRTASLTLGELATRWGTHKPHVHRAIAELVESRALRRNEDGSYSFLKDYASWRKAGRSKSSNLSRLTEAELDSCRSARSRALGFSGSHTDPIVTHSGNAGADPGPTSDESYANPIVTHSGNATVTPMGNAVTHSGNAALPIRVTPLSEEEEERLKTPPTPPSGGTGVGGIIPDPGPEPECEPFAAPAPETPPAVPAPPPSGWRPEDFARLEAEAERLFPLLEFGTKVRRNAHLFPPAYFEAALREAAFTGKRVRFPYVLAICRRFEEDGGPPPPERSGVGVRSQAPATPIPDYVTPPPNGYRKSYPTPKKGGQP